MMVNYANNNIPPWQSTIPSQMPWLDPYAASNPMMQFGQMPLDQINTTHQSGTTTASSTDTNLATQTLLNPTRPQDAILTDTRLTSPCVTTATTLNSTLVNPFDFLPTSGVKQTTCGNAQPPVVGSTQAMQYPHQQSTNPLVAPDSHFAGTSLTQLPAHQQNLIHLPGLSRSLNQKRSSLEMEDDLTASEAPPTKQQLSENKLFRRFGTLQLDGEKLENVGEPEDTDSDSSDDFVGKDGFQDRKEFNRYVYLLFKDKKSNNLFNESTSGAMDKLIKDEREKLSKAVILWSPPLKDTLAGSLNQGNYDDDDEEEFKYTDHKDFLKEGRATGEEADSIIITEVEDDVPIVEVEPTEMDDLMQD